MAMSFGGAEAWMARAMAGKSKPMPIPETRSRKTQAGMVVVGDRMYSRPEPMVVRVQPIQSAQR